MSASRRPSSPLVAVSVSRPSLRKARATRRSTPGSSSIARTRSLIYGSRVELIFCHNYNFCLRFWGNFAVGWTGRSRTEGMAGARPSLGGGRSPGGDRRRSPALLAGQRRRRVSQHAEPPQDDSLTQRPGDRSPGGPARTGPWRRRRPANGSWLPASSPDTRSGRRARILTFQASYPAPRAPRRPFRPYGDRQPTGRDTLPAIMTLEQSLATWLPAQRWYPGGSAAVELAIIADTPLASGDPELRHLVVGVSSGGDAVRYQVLAGVRAEVPKALQHAVIGPDGRGGTAYDALHDPELTRVLLLGITSERAAGPLRFVAEPGAPIDTTAASLVLSAEQSNTSLIFGESAILKVFRRVFPGQNPDLEVTRALARLGSQHVAAPFGWIQATLDGEGEGEGGGGNGGNGDGNGDGHHHGEPALLAL